MRFLTLFTVCLGLMVGTASAQVGENQGLVNPNLATASELRALPHVTDAVAAAIESNRPFLSAIQLDGILARSLGESQRSELYSRLFRPMSLNTASGDEIKLIPGMSDRMVHEFEEYRPYTSMEQFRREIGKYVDDDEVARFQQYVFAPMNLNDASSEDFMTIPGMTARMVREFEEYRPYTSMEQFRREIGKYVDEDEVARLESYVTLD